MATIIKKPEEIVDILTRACWRRELLILATPYLRFESNFVTVQGEELHVLATMSHEDAVYGLRTADLKIRFPYGLGFYEAAVTSVGLGLHEGKRTVRVTLPKVIRESDQRVGYRVDRVGRVAVTFGTPKATLHAAGLVDISTTGAQLHTQREIAADELATGDRIILDIPLADGIAIHSEAIVRHLAGRRLGIQFDPKLAEEIGEPLSRWVFLRREEERERTARRLEAASQPDLRSGTQVPESGILLVSSDALMEADLRAALSEIRPVARIAPALQELKEALGAKPSLAIFHLDGTGLDERRRMKTLTDLAQRKIPILLLGTRVDGSTLFELSGEWKASSAMVWSPDRALFLQRLVQGILRRHSAGGDSPMAPREVFP